MKNNVNTRRSFLKNAIKGLAVSGVVPISSYPFLRKNSSSISSSVSFGFITDLHHGLCKDALSRLEIFIQDCKSRELDFIMQ